MKDDKNNYVELKYQTSKDLVEAQYYLKMLDDFCKTGKVVIPAPSGNVMPWNKEEDTMTDFLVWVFNLKLDDRYKFQAQVRNSKLKSRVFYDYVGKFIVECVHHIRFQRQRAWSESHRADDILDWPDYKRMDRKWWIPLLHQLEKEHGDEGFDLSFFLRLFSGGGAMKTENWERLAREWKACIERQSQNRLKLFIAARRDTFIKGLTMLMDQMTQCIKRREIPEERALQAWEFMQNGWTETEFERSLNRVEIQDRYPVIREIVAQMGRIADANGKDRLTIASGVDMKMEHSSGSDIEGITVGNDLNTLLPTELAQYSDDDAEGLFFHKYRMRELQNFRYKSEMSKPSRRLGFTHASRKGPMIVCLDTSASMYGPPERIASTLIALLEGTAEDLERDCFLIDFSVSTRAIDLREKRKMKRLQKLGLYHQESSDGRQSATTHIPFIGGGTSALKMMKLMFDMLDNDDQHYVNADVLWITDFAIPAPTQAMLDKVKQYRDTGTRFYGFRIVSTEDKEPNQWESHFNKIYTIKYRPLRRY